MINPKDVVVYVNAVDIGANAQRIFYAGALAKHWNAHVAVAFVPEDLTLAAHAGFARGTAIADMLDKLKIRREESESEVRSAVNDVKARFGVSCELRLCDGQTGEALMLHARHAAIAILGSSRRPDRQVSALTLSEDVIFASGRPSILVPSEWSVGRPIGKVVVGWNGSREAARAISDAMPFLIAAAEVRVIVVSEPKISRLLGHDPGTDISRHLARYGVSLVLEQFDSANAGDQPLTSARQIDADLIVVGAYGQPKISEFAFGSATQTLLANADRPVMLSR